MNESDLKVVRLIRRILKAWLPGWFVVDTDVVVL